MTLDVAFLLLTETGYDLQKSISPIAAHIVWGMGSEKTEIGLDVSGGAPQISPIAYRRHAGISYNSSFYDNSYSGWETRWGAERSLNFGIATVSYSGTEYTSGGTSQTTNMLSGSTPLLGMPAKVSFEQDGYTSFGGEDWGINVGEVLHNTIGIGVPSSLGDRYRTAALRVSYGPFSYGFNLFTGDPGALDINDRPREQRADDYKYYTGGNCDQYRVGAEWFGVGPFRFGTNSEQFRHQKQNIETHDPRGIPRYTVLPRQDEPYFYFGSGTGNSLW